MNRIVLAIAAAALVAGCSTSNNGDSDGSDLGSSTIQRSTLGGGTDLGSLGSGGGAGGAIGGGMGAGGVTGGSPAVNGNGAGEAGTENQLIER